MGFHATRLGLVLALCSCARSGENTGVDAGGLDTVIDAPRIDSGDRARNDTGTDDGSLAEVDSGDAHCSISDGSIGQSCVRGGGLFFDQSNVCVEFAGGRECTTTGRIYRLNQWNYMGRRYLVVSTYTSLDLYDITRPSEPSVALLAGAYNPWQGTVPQADYDELQWDGAFLDDSPYGYATFRRLGWVTFQVRMLSGRLFYDVLDRQALSDWYHDSPTRARFFRSHDGSVYLVGWVDLNSPSNAVGRFDAGRFTVVAQLPPMNRFLEITYRDGVPYVVGVTPNDSRSDRLVAYSLATPASPALVWSRTFDRNVVDADYDPDTQRVFVLRSGMVSVFDFGNPAAPSEVTSFAAGGGLIAGSRNLIVLSQFGGGELRVWSIADPAMPRSVTDLVLSLHSNEDGLDIDVVYDQTSDEYVIFRAAFSVGTYHRIAGSCACR